VFVVFVFVGGVVRVVWCGVVCGVWRVACGVAWRDLRNEPFSVVGVVA
jgi:hypothetical protein